MNELHDREKIREQLEIAAAMTIGKVIYAELGSVPAKFNGQLSYVPVPRYTLALPGCSLELLMIHHGVWQKVQILPGEAISFAPNSLIATCEQLFYPGTLAIVQRPQYIRLVYAFRDKIFYYHLQEFSQASAHSIVLLADMVNHPDRFQVAPHLMECSLKLILDDFNQESNSHPHSGAQHTFARIEDYCSANQLNDINRSTIARKFQISESYISRLFKRFHPEESFNHYISRLRLEYAARLLEQTSLHVTEVADACRFAGVAHFIRQFKRRYGMTPLAWRLNKSTAKVTKEQ